MIDAERIAAVREKARYDVIAGRESSSVPFIESVNRLVAFERAEAANDKAIEWECGCGQHERDIRITQAEEALEAAMKAVEDA